MRLVRLAVVVAIVSLFAIPAQSVQAQGTASPSAPISVPTIQVRDLQQFIKTGTQILLLDVREPEEYRQGHIAGAVLMPLGTLSAQYSQIPKGITLVVYCRTGHRSAQAVKFLREHGYDKSVSLAGGYTAWSGAALLR
jgi:rhodanese-related sulfurtransferase